MLVKHRSFGRQVFDMMLGRLNYDSCFFIILLLSLHLPNSNYKLLLYILSVKLFFVKIPNFLENCRPLPYKYPF